MAPSASSGLMMLLIPTSKYYSHAACWCLQIGTAFVTAALMQINCPSNVLSPNLCKHVYQTAVQCRYNACSSNVAAQMKEAVGHVIWTSFVSEELELGQALQAIDAR